MAIRLMLLSVLIFLLTVPRIAPIRSSLECGPNVFSTTGHPKARGVNLSMAYPAGITAKDSDDPDVVQQFVHESGLGRAMISTRDLRMSLGTAPTIEQVGEELAPSKLQARLPTGHELIEARPTDFEGFPACILEWSMPGSLEGEHLPGPYRVWEMNFIEGGTGVRVAFVQFSLASGPAGQAGRWSRFKGVADLMVRSLVLDSSGTLKGMSSPKTRDQHSLSGGPLADATMLQSDAKFHARMNLALQVGWEVGAAMLALAMGLSLPLFIRIVFARPRVSLPSASLIAAGWSAFLWVAGFFDNPAPLGAPASFTGSVVLGLNAVCIMYGGTLRGRRSEFGIGPAPLL
jgi:hypothetical protein